MSSRERVLKLGSRVRFHEDEHRVVAMDGVTVTLQDPDGRLAGSSPMTR